MKHASIITQLFHSLETPPPPPPLEQSPAAPQNKKRWFGKKTLALVAVIAAVVVVVALFIPPGTAVIPLNVDYVVGEKMVYDTSISVSYQMDNSSLSSAYSGLSQQPVSVNGQQTIEVMDFDGEFYYLNHTTNMDILGSPVSFSIMEKINKTGYSTYMLNLGSTQQEISADGLTSDSYLAQLLNLPEAKVGDSFTVPFPVPENQYLETSGNLTVTFGGIEELTVPAGTYKVFKIDITSNHLQMSVNTQILNTPISMTSNIDIHYQIYLEYGTLREIKSNLQETVSYAMSGISANMQMTMDMTLTQHTKP
jgi:hypothetical protein